MFRKIDKNDLKKIIEAHKDWVDSNGADGIRANLAWADMSYQQMPDFDFKHVNLCGAILTNANLKSSNFVAANLAYADLSGANMSYAYLLDANLYHANLSGADFRWVNFRYVDFTGANLSNIQLSYPWIINSMGRLAADPRIINHDVMPDGRIVDVFSSSAMHQARFSTK